MSNSLHGREGSRHDAAHDSAELGEALRKTDVEEDDADLAGLKVYCSGFRVRLKKLVSRKMMPIWQDLLYRVLGFHLGRNESERGRSRDLPLINLERCSDDTSVRQDKT
jgi:hypothetical protein